MFSSTNSAFYKMVKYLEIKLFFVISSLAVLLFFPLEIGRLCMQHVVGLIMQFHDCNTCGTGRTRWKINRDYLPLICHARHRICTQELPTELIYNCFEEMHFLFQRAEIAKLTCLAIEVPYLWHRGTFYCYKRKHGLLCIATQNC